METETRQSFKAVYFPDYKAANPHAKGLVLAFGKKDQETYQKVSPLSSQEIREFLNTSTYSELVSAAGREGLPVNTYCLWQLRKVVNAPTNMKQRVSSMDPIHATFRGGRKNPLHNWYSYLEGYSPEYVEYILDKYIPNASSVYDPFAGTGVTPLVAAQRGLISYYSEINPLLQFLVQSKINASMLSPKRRRTVIDKLQKVQSTLSITIQKTYPDIQLRKSYSEAFGESQFFDQSTFQLVLKARTLVDQLSYSDQIVADLVQVAIINSLIPASLLERAGDVRFKTEKELKRKTNFISQTSQNLSNIITDIKNLEPLPTTPILISENTKLIGKVPCLNVDAVITSPPYLNGTNYFRNTKVELWFLRSIKDPSDLSGFRRATVTAGINDVSQKKETIFLTSEIKSIVRKLESKAYDSRIPKMVADYFQDIGEVFGQLKKHLTNNARIAIDIGDSIYGGVKVPTDELYVELLKKLDYRFEESIVLRKRISRNGEILKQVLLIFSNKKSDKANNQTKSWWVNDWNNFKRKLPHRSIGFAKRNWGHPLHSLCSYQGKMKPSLAYFLVKTFTKKGNILLDPFGGVGTIPFEGALNGVKSYSFEISPAALVISKAKLGRPNKKEVFQYTNKLERYLENYDLNQKTLLEAKVFGFNKRLEDYYEPRTLREIVKAREFFKDNPPATSSENLVLASLLHILHGNRPYALSRRSHGITPFAPTGEFIYKSLIKHLKEKAERSLELNYPKSFVEGEAIFQDATSWWPRSIDNLDAVITSPPFFDSTRFYLANWIRLWFTGWNPNDFSEKPLGFVDEKQKVDFSVYEPILRQSRERLKTGGVLVFHLGKSRKCDMAERLQVISKKWFKTADIFEENVEDTESHGIRDKGTVVKHQFLILT